MKNLKILLLKITLMFFILLLIGCENKSVELSTDLSQIGNFPMPIFAQLEKDIKGGNEIIAVFFEKKYKAENPMLEVSVVFKDEDHPNFVYNFLHDIYRFFKYGRIKDIESFYILFEDEALEKPLKILFPGVYGDELPYDVVENLHGSAEIPYEEFEFESKRPIIFVNTWNHMFSEREPIGSSVLIYNYPVYKGSRETAEKFFSFRIGW